MSNHGGSMITESQFFCFSRDSGVIRSSTNMRASDSLERHLNEPSNSVSLKLCQNITSVKTTNINHRLSSNIKYPIDGSTYNYTVKLPFDDAAGGLEYVNSNKFTGQIRRNMKQSGWNLPQSSNTLVKQYNSGQVKRSSNITTPKSRIKLRPKFKYDTGPIKFKIDLGIISSPIKNVSNLNIKSDRNWSEISREDMKTISQLYTRLEKIKIFFPDYFDTMDKLKDYSNGVKLAQWGKVKDIIQRWILPWTNESRTKLYATISEYTKINGMINIYIDRLNGIQRELAKFIKCDKDLNIQESLNNGDIDKSRINSLLSEAALTSGGIAFYGSIGVSLVETAKVCNVDHLFYFTSLYMLTDHWLDDPTMNEKTKMETARTLMKLIEDPQPVKEPPVLAVMTDCLLKLIRAVPKCYKSLKDAFYAEMVSAVVQKQANLPGSVYLKICEWKGGAMLQAMQTICGSAPDRSGYLVGACIQLVDDMHDIDEDIADGINTIATYIKDKYGNLDPLFLYTVNMLSHFDNKHTLFKPCILGMMMHSIAIIPHFSKELYDVCYPYFPFGRTYDLRGVIYDRMMRVMRSGGNQV